MSAYVPNFILFIFMSPFDYDHLVLGDFNHELVGIELADVDGGIESIFGC